MTTFRKVHPNGDSYCSACKIARSIKDQKENKDKYRVYRQRSSLKKRYGVSPEFIEDKPCEICGKVYESGKRFHVDHNHLTGEVRGVLCHSCNTAIGLFKEDLVILTSAITYLSMAGKKKKRK